MFLNIMYVVLLSRSNIKGEIPKVGGAEKLKLQLAIPPFSLIEDSIHGKRVETLVNTA